jgi:hypothetical protein
MDGTAYNYGWFYVEFFFCTVLKELMSFRSPHVPERILLMTADNYMVPNGHMEVMIKIKSGIEFKRTLEVGSGLFELVGAKIVVDHGQKVNIVSVYCAPRWGESSNQAGDALAVVSHPILVLGDFNTHSQSWGCGFEDSAVQNMFDDLNLVHLNDGTCTRIAALSLVPLT